MSDSPKVGRASFSCLLFIKETRDGAPLGDSSQTDGYLNIDLNRTPLQSLEILEALV